MYTLPSTPAATMTDLSAKSADEIHEMTKRLQEEAKLLGIEHEKNEQKIKTANEHFRELLPNVTEVQQIARRRTEQLEKKRRLEKKILAIYARFPRIIDAKQPQIISTDVTILNRQLDLIQSRKDKSEKAIEELEKKRSDLEQKMADVKGDRRREADLMIRRDQDKAQLTQSLKKELEASKNLYVSEGRVIDRKLSYLNQKTTDLNPELSEMRQGFERLNTERPGKLSVAPPANAQASQALNAKRQALVMSINNFIDFWAARRMLRHWQDREELLREVLDKTTDRKGMSYNSIKMIEETNQAKVAELNRYKSMSSELEGKNAEVQRRNEKLKTEIARLEERKANPNYTKEVEARINKLKETHTDLEKKAKSIELEIRSYEGTNNGPTRGESCYIRERLAYRKQVLAMGEMMKEVNKLKQELESMDGAVQRSASLQQIGDPRLLLSEDKDLVFVQAAPIDLLASLLFNPSNVDKHYITGLLVLVHSQKEIEFQPFVQALVSAYEYTEFVEVRAQRMNQLVTKWCEWFPNDLQDQTKKSLLTPVFNTIGSTGIFDMQPKNYEDILWDQSVPFNDREEQLAFCAMPLILAEHFTYYELMILREIPPYEFTGTGWTAVDKWAKAPHIVKMTDHFNTMTQWIVASIVMKDRIEERVRLLERWIEIMEAAAQILNFQLVFEIFGALCNPALTHLSRTWERISPEAKQTYEEFRALTTPTSRFENYRKKLVEHPAEIVVPYIGPMLTSLVYVADGNPSKKTLPESGEMVWNFAKYRAYAQTMGEICGEWGSDVRFILNPALFQKISSITPAEQTDAELFQISQQVKE